MNEEENKKALDQCDDRVLYIITARNLRLAVFIKERNEFIGIREKFGEKYLDKEIHRGVGGTATQWERIGVCPIVIPQGASLFKQSDWQTELFHFLSAFPPYIENGAADGYIGVYQLQRLKKP